MNAVYLTSDLLFSSRVGASARSLGVNLRLVRSREDLIQQVTGGSVSLVVVDLEHADAHIGELMSSLAQTSLAQASPRPAVVAYGPHVKAPLLAAAQQAGCDWVLSRGQFDQQFAGLLTKLASGSSAALRPQLPP